MSEVTTADAVAEALEAPQSSTKDDLSQAIARRQAALDRARDAEARLEALQAKLSTRDLAEKEEQGKWQELATEHKTAADELAGRLKTAESQLSGLQDRHRGVLMARVEALPDSIKATLLDDLGEAPELDQLDRAVKLAEALSSSHTSTTPKPARQVNGRPTATTSTLRGGSKMDAYALSKLTRDERRIYLKEQYGL